MTLKEQLQQHRQEILEIAVKHGASNVRLVGGDNAPYRNNENDKIYFLVKMEHGRSLLDLGGLLVDLEDLLDGEIHVWTEGGFRGDERNQVLSETITI